MNKLNLPIDDKYNVNYNKRLGEGAYAQVFFARNRKTKEPVAVKVFTVSSQEDLVDVKAEVKALLKLKNQYVVRCIETFESEVYYCVVLEYIENGNSLVDLFMDERATSKSKWHKKLTESNVQHIIRQVTEGLYYAMTKKICHRDVKLDNVLVRDFDTYDVVLADFNFSKELNKTSSLMRTKLGTPGFVAPEIISSLGYNYKCDIWSLGVMFYSLISWGNPPFLDYSSDMDIDSYERTFKNLPNLKLTFIPKDQFKPCSKESKDLLTRMLKVNPKKRCPYKKIKKHDWFLYDAIPNDEFNLNRQSREAGRT